MAKTVNHLSDEEIALVKESSLLVGRTLAEVAKRIAPGVTTGELDRMAEEFIRDNGAIPGFKGLYGCPSTLLTSVNEQVVHGLPGDTPLEAVSYTHLRAHETVLDLVCRLLLEKKKKNKQNTVLVSITHK